jgi:hypothetical protein
MTLDVIEDLIKNRKVKPDDVRSMQKECHPDRFVSQPDSVQQRAERLFKALATIADAAKKPAIKLKSPTRVYELLELITVGDAADIFRATADGKDYLVKVSRHQTTARMLDVERKCLAELLTKADGATYEKYLPLLAESFTVRDKFEKRINVFTDDGQRRFALVGVHAAYPELDGRHVAWIFKRLLEIIGFLGNNVHGSVVPKHIVLSPDNHGLKLFGWGHSVKAGEVMTTVPAEYKSWYPAEVLKKRPVNPNLDIYLAAKSMEYLCPLNKLPTQFANFLRSCMLESPGMRPSDAWDLHKDFAEMLRAVYGAPRFLELVL